MINFDTIKISLQEWIVRSTPMSDESVVFNDQAAIRPSKPYISMKLFDIINIGGDDARSLIDDNGDADFIGNREFTLSIQSYGNGNLNNLSLLIDSLNNPNELQLLRDDSLIFVDQLLFSDIPELLETIWEERGILDLLFRTTSISNHQVGIIEGVNIKGDYKNIDGSSIAESKVVIQIPDATAGVIPNIHDMTIEVITEEVTLL